MPRISCSLHKRRLRTFISALILTTLALTSFAGHDSAQAQRDANSAAASPAKKPTSKKRVFVGRVSASGAGARQTIKSDKPLNDYSAYRSGDRFNVVIPNADANSIAKGGGGRGYMDMQVQQRGADVVISYLLQPGAKPRVEQQFNRLDVVFENPFDAAPQSVNKSASTATDSAAKEGRAPNTQPTQATPRAAQAAPLSTGEFASNRIVSASARESAPQQRDPSASPAELSSASAPATVEAAPSASVAPAEAQVASAQPSATTSAAPSTQTNVTTDPTLTSESLGVKLLRNWPIVLAVALLAIIFSLFFAARRASATNSAPVEDKKAKAAARSELKAATTTVGLKDEPAPASQSARGLEPIAGGPLAAASSLAGATAAKAVIGKKHKKSKKKNKRQTKTEPLPVESAPPSNAETPLAENALAQASTSGMIVEEEIAEEAPAVQLSAPAVEEAFAVVTPEAAVETENAPRAERVVTEPEPTAHVGESEPVETASSLEVAVSDALVAAAEPQEAEPNIEDAAAWFSVVSDVDAHVAAPPSFAAEVETVEAPKTLPPDPEAVAEETTKRVAAIADLARLDTNESFQQICSAFDDEEREVRCAAARALFDLRPERADTFTRALREATPERRRHIGAAINDSGLADEAISQLTGESREHTYEAFSLLFLMAKASEVKPLLRAIEAHPNHEVRLAVVKLLALSGQKEVLPAFRRLAVRGSLPTEVRSAIMEAIYQISSSQDATTTA